MSTAIRTEHTARLQIDHALGRLVVVIDKPVVRIGRSNECDVRPAGADVSARQRRARVPSR